MAFKVLSITRFNGGISIGDKETITSVYNQNGLNSSWRFGYGVNIHDEPSKFSALPKSLNVLSGAYGAGIVLQDELRWIRDGYPWINNVFAYGSTGRVYQEDAAGNWTYIHTVPNSVGNGMEVFNDYLYCVGDTTISRYGPLDGTPTWSDSWQTGLNSTNALGFAPCLVFSTGLAIGHGNSVGFLSNSLTPGFTTFTAYTVGNVIVYSGQYWRCILAYTTGNATTITPDIDTTHWAAYTSSTAPVQWTVAAIQLPSGVNITSLCRIEQYLAIGTTGSTSIFDNENGYIFMWDGSSPYFNFFNNIEQGSCNALVNYRNQPLSINGSQGIIYLGYDPFIKVHQLPKLPISGAVQVYPGAVTSWKGKVYIGFGARSIDPNFVRGVYSWGSKVNAYPDALTCDFLASTGNYGPTVQITACTGMGNSLYIGWRDGSTCGIDKVTYTNQFQSKVRMDYLIFDDGRIAQDKKADTFQIYHSNLNPGESISIYYRSNRTDTPGFAYLTTPVYTHTYSSADLEPNITRWSPATTDGPRFYELEIGVSIQTTGGTTPYVYGMSMKYNDLTEEGAI